MKEYVIRPKTRDTNMFVINNSGEELIIRDRTTKYKTFTESD